MTIFEIVFTFINSILTILSIIVIFSNPKRTIKISKNLQNERDIKIKNDEILAKKILLVNEYMESFISMIVQKDCDTKLSAVFIQFSLKIRILFQDDKNIIKSLHDIRNQYTYISDNRDKMSERIKDEQMERATSLQKNLVNLLALNIGIDEEEIDVFGFRLVKQ